MNKWNRLLKMLDTVYGFENQVKSSFRKIKQGFDERSNEHVFVIEYRVRRSELSAKALKRKQAKDAGEIRRANQVKIGKLLRDINDEAGRIVLTGEPDTKTQSSPIETIP
jgi:hypothetical protein